MQYAFARVQDPNVREHTATDLIDIDIDTDGNVLEHVTEVRSYKLVRGWCARGQEGVVLQPFKSGGELPACHTRRHQCSE